MDLAESILNELVSLQKKNEELLGIIRRLEHESDVIIRQFEDKIADLNKNLKKAQDSSAKSEKKYELLSREKNREHESFEKEKLELESEYKSRITELETDLNQQISSIHEKDMDIRTLHEQMAVLEQSIAEKTEGFNSRIFELNEELVSAHKISESEINTLRSEFEREISEAADELSRKDKELRTLANDLKTRMAEDKKAKKEWDKKQTHFDETITKLRAALESERSKQQNLLSDYSEEKARMAKSIQELQFVVAGLEKSQTRIQVEYNSRIETLLAEINTLTGKQQSDAITLDALTQENHDLVTLSEQLNSDLSEKESQITLLLGKIELLTSEMESKIADIIHDNDQKVQELSIKDNQISDLKRELSEARDQSRDSITSLESSLQTLHEQLSGLQIQMENRETSYQSELSGLTNQVEQVTNDLNKTLRLKDQREQEFRDEITYLHEELIKQKSEWKDKLESGARDLAERDRHISLISGNNEALRSELERVRSRLLLLEKTIREDKEEPVHALYRQIQTLSAKLAGKESENSVMASRILRLDTENTRLAHQLAESGVSEDSHTSLKRERSDKKGGKKAAITQSDISVDLSNLEDPVHAMDAAASILRSGTQVTDILIPLLYRGTLNRRAWVAVILYELNDPKATKPLSDLLEASESGLRELIWDTRLRFREYRRSGTVTSVAQKE